MWSLCFPLFLDCIPHVCRGTIPNITLGNRTAHVVVTTRFWNPRQRLPAISWCQVCMKSNALFWKAYVCKAWLVVAHNVLVKSVIMREIDQNEI